MYLLRGLCRKKVIVQIGLAVFLVYCLVTVWLFSNEYQSRLSMQDSNMTAISKFSSQVRYCNLPNNRRASNADIFTYDLPLKTNYSFVTGKQFKEYVIPVHSEKVAHLPQLDPVTVMIIPFSHVDPGYGLTMEEYYVSTTKFTLDNMVDKLYQYPDMTFQWAETVFLERWWRDINDDVKARVRELVRRGQLEIVTGGWIMPDEASTHYVAVVDQLIEGHQWLIENLGVIPENSWSNDPFGFSSTMPYLWKKSGMENMVILRIHQAIKATLMKMKAMEFQWRQLWSKDTKNEILCHLMPYRGYWVGDTCGPYNQPICREYAFMHTEEIHKVVFVTKDNLAERARILYEQYRITSEIYRRHGAAGMDNGGGVKLFLPMFLGEDFSFKESGDYDRIYENYKLLMDYINAKKEWGMTLKYGTLKEYFSSVRQFQKERTQSDGSRFPTLAGDFFPYSDYQNDYWTGYYTTRPFNKQMSRELQSVLRMADIFHSYAVANNRSRDSGYDAYTEVTSSLSFARRELGMFLHHDGITGTSVIHVTEDFGQRLWDALNKAKSALERIVKTIITTQRGQPEQSIQSTTGRPTRDSVSNEKVLMFSKSGGRLYVASSSSRKRSEVIHFLTTAPIEIFNGRNAKLPVEYREMPVMSSEGKKVVQVSFIADIPPLGIEIFNVQNVPVLSANQFIQQRSDHDSKITIENQYIRAEFDSIHGSLLAITDILNENIRTTIVSSILKYETDRSGAYIFAPKGEATNISLEIPKISSSIGKLVSEVKVEYAQFTIWYWLNQVTGVDGQCLHFKTEFLVSTDDTEVIMRFKSDIRNGNRFFTDQNGFQMMGRRTYPDRPVEQNYYPLTSMMMLEDDARRLTLHAGQPHGVASLQSGWIEVMLDRFVFHDDDKGLGQGVTDTKLTHTYFAIQLETVDKQEPNRDILYTYPSEAALLINDILTDPLYKLASEDSKGHSVMLKSFNPIRGNLPCGVKLVSMRTLAKANMGYNGTSLVLHHTPSYCEIVSKDTGCRQDDPNSVSLATLFPEFDILSSMETSLTHLYSIKNIHDTEELTPESMELRSFIVEF